MCFGAYISPFITITIILTPDPTTYITIATTSDICEI